MIDKNSKKPVFGKRQQAMDGVVTFSENEKSGSREKGTGKKNINDVIREAKKETGKTGEVPPSPSGKEKRRVMDGTIQFSESGSEQEQKGSGKRKLGDIINNAKNRASGVVSDLEDFKRQYTHANGNDTDFERAVRKGVNGPVDDREASKFGRSLPERMEKAYREKAAEKGDPVAREAAIQKNIRTIEREMDKAGTDFISPPINGYYCRFIRTPIEGGNTEIKVNGRTAYVHKNLEGDTVAKIGNRTEASMDMAEKAADSMMATGAVSWDKLLDTGAEASIRMSVTAGRGKVEINRSLKGNEINVRQGGLYISRDIWEYGYQSMRGYGRNRWMTTMQDGKTVECGYVISVNGKPAYINNDPDALHINAQFENESISEAKWNGILALLKANGTKMYAETLPDGTTLSVKLVAKVNDREAQLGDGMPAWTIEDRAQVTEISAEKWAEVKTAMLTDPNGKCTIPLEDGSKISGNFEVTVDGEKAFVNCPMGKGEIREGKGCFIIAEDIFNDTMKSMEDAKSTTFSGTVGDGKELSVKRESEMILEHTDKDGVTTVYRGKAFRDAVAEISGMNTDAERDHYGEMYAAIMDQAGLQITRSSVSNLMSSPGKYVNNMKNLSVQGEQSAFGPLKGWFSQLVRAGQIRG